MAYFSDIPDPRKDTNKLYPLYEVIAITILAVMSFAKGWEDIERYGKAKREWLSKFLELKEGIPHHDVYRRVFTALNPELIEVCFMNWVRSIREHLASVATAKEEPRGNMPLPREIIAIDGKTARGSFNVETGKALHIVSAWATANRLVFGQVKTDEKSNEITAIPTLLDKMLLEGSIVTIDAMGCQYEIANKIVKKKADYVFSLKGNQGNLCEDVEAFFVDLDFSKPPSAMRHISFQSISTHEKQRGRIEDRDYAVSGDVQWLHERHPHWKTIQSIGLVDSRREVKGKVTCERRYFISSLPADIHEFARAVRSHWGIENSLHYVLDVALGEDRSRNMAFIRKIVLTIARSDTETKSSVTGRVKEMAWSDEYREKMLFDSNFAV
jgi:predicted transposase YbfD/YdcC